MSARVDEILSSRIYWPNPGDRLMPACCHFRIGRWKLFSRSPQKTRRTTIRRVKGETSS